MEEKDLFYDNRVFNINGQGKEMLSLVMQLAFHQAGRREALGWMDNREKGLIFYGHQPSNPGQWERLPVPFDCAACTELAWAYLSSELAWKAIQLEGWDRNLEHDGSNDRGWRVYCEDWGKVGESDDAIIAVTPAYLWYGK